MSTYSRYRKSVKLAHLSFLFPVTVMNFPKVPHNRTLSDIGYKETDVYDFPHKTQDEYRRLDGARDRGINSRTDCLRSKNFPSEKSVKIFMQPIYTINYAGDLGRHRAHYVNVMNTTDIKRFRYYFSRVRHGIAEFHNALCIRWWRHHQNVNTASETLSPCMKIVYRIIVYGSLCRKYW